jgi:S1-C subfamily serine protease
MLRQINRTRAWVALIVGVLLTGMFFPMHPAGAALEKAKIDRAMLSTVKIIILDPDGKPFGTCSGTHVGGGYIVANWHCVGHTDLYGEDDTGMGLQNGDTYNPDGLVVIAPQKDPKQLPKPTFIAKLVAGNPDVDVSVVKIISMLDQNTPLPGTLPMAVMTQDDSDKVEVGDPGYVFGYPGAGGDLITYSEGTISGFEDQTGDGEPDSFKTTAAISPGNSGGLAVDQDGNQIGIPTYQSKIGSGLGGLRQINIAVPYIKQALSLADSTPGSTNPGVTTTPGPTPQGTPGTTNGPFGPISFGTDVQNGKLVNPGTSFDSGTEQVIGAFAFQGMRNGMKWGWVWQYNGKTVIDSRNKATWEDGASGVTAVSLSNDGGLPDGSFKVQLYVTNSVVQEGSFVIGSAQGNTTPTPPTPSTEGVVLKGRIVDADTSRGVPGGVVVVLKPGTTLDEWDNSKGDELAAAIGVADNDGYYLTSPGLDRDQTYTVIVAARNYERRVFEDGLQITADDSALIELDDLAIQKR